MSAASTITTLARQRAAAEGRARTAERQLAATVDELTEAQTENARLAALVVEAFDLLDAAQAVREQAEAQRDRALEVLTLEQDAHQRTKTLLRLAQHRKPQDPFGPVMR